MTSKRGVPALVAATMLAMAALGAGGTTTQAESRQGLVRLATLPLPDDFNQGASGYVLVDSGARRIIYGEDSSEATATTRYRSYNLDTLQLADTWVSGFNVGSTTNASVSALDPEHHRMFAYDANFHLWSFKTAPLGADAKDLGPMFSSAFGSELTQSVEGLWYSVREHTLYTVGGPTPNDSGTSQTPVTIAAYAPDTGARLWFSTVPQCHGLTNYWQQQPIGKFGQYLFTTCVLPGVSGNRAGAVVRVGAPASQDLGGAQYNSPVDLYPGLTLGEAGATDEALWVEKTHRLVTIVPTAGATGWGSYVFDAPTAMFVASPTLFEPSSTAVSYGTPITFTADQTTGRVYTQDYAVANIGTQNSVACKRPAPELNAINELETIGTGNAIVQIASGDGGLSGNDRGAAIDSTSRNLWMIDFPKDATSTCNGNGSGGKPRIVVYHDGMPPAHEAQLTDLDAGTTGLAERVGTTSANYGAQASAYGIRYQLAPSGVDGALTSADVPSIGTLTCRPDTAYAPLYAGFQSGGAGVSLPSQPDTPPLPAAYHAFCHAGSRQATFGRIADTALDQSGIRVDAIAGETDRASAQDLAAATDASRPGQYADHVVGYYNSMGSGTAPVPLPTVSPQPCEQTASPPGANGDACSPFSPNGPLSHAGVDASGYQPYVSGQALPFKPASCRDSGGAANGDTAHSSIGLGQAAPLTTNGPSEAQVNCNMENPQGWGAVYTSQPQIGYPIFAHDARASTDVRKTMQVGTQATADSVVDAVHVGDLLSIGRLELHAVAAAHGRPGTTTVTYQCRVTDVQIILPDGLGPPAVSGLPSQAPTPAVPQSVVVPSALPGPIPSGATAPGVPPGQPLVQPVTVMLPGTRACDDPALTNDIEQFNHQLQQYVRIDFPAAPSLGDLQSAQPPVPEPDLQAVKIASPGGYLAALQASKLRQSQDTVLLSDTSTEQPGMVVTVVGDSGTERDRFVASFGGVAAMATYGIFPLTSCTACGPPSEPNVDSGPVPQTGASPTLPGSDAFPPGGGTGGTPDHGGPLAAIQKIVATVVDGFKVLWQHPELIPPLAAVWALLAWPGFVLARRRSLGLTIGGGQ